MIKIVFGHFQDCTYVLFVVGPNKSKDFDFQEWAESRRKAMKFLKTTVSCREIIFDK